MSAWQIIFHASNVLIALDYFLIGLFFLGRVRSGISVRRTNPRALLGLAAMIIFFFGCVHTHVNLVILGEGLNPHWFHPLDVFSHAAQGVGGLAFWWLARQHLVINIYDRVVYDEATASAREQAETEARLDRLALQVGLRNR